MISATENKSLEISPNHLLKQSDFSPALPPRVSDAHKGNFGTVAIVGGDSGMVGAVLLAARAALFCGAGRVHAVFLAGDAPIVDMQHPEIMLHSAEKLSALKLSTLKQLTCIAIGPGLGQSQAAIELLTFCMAQKMPLLIDADGLNLISQHPYLAMLLQQRQADTVITPHPAEAARLLQTTTESVQENRVESALNLAKNLNVVCVLKGAGTICADAHSNWFKNTTGNPSLATGGTGDVLSGIIASLIAQHLDVLQAAKLGVYVHGAAADALVEKGIGPIGLTASEIALEARNQFNYLNKLNEKL